MSYSGKSHIGIQSARQPNVSTQTIVELIGPTRGRILVFELFPLDIRFQPFQLGIIAIAPFEMVITSSQSKIDIEKSFQPPAIPSDFSLRPESNRSMIVCRNSDIVVTGRIRRKIPDKRPHTDTVIAIHHPHRRRIDRPAVENRAPRRGIEHPMLRYLVERTDRGFCRGKASGDRRRSGHIQPDGAERTAVASRPTTPHCGRTSCHPYFSPTAHAP